MPKQKAEIKELADKLDRIADELSGVRPILISLQDTADPDLSSLDAVGGLMGYCANSIIDIKARLDELAEA
jgi:hypothetical protein